MVADGNPYKYAALAARKTKNRYNQRSHDSMRIAGPFRPAGHQKKSDRMAEIHPAAIQFGVPRSEPRPGQAGGDGASENVYNFAARNRQYSETTRNAEIIRNNKTSGNNRKPLGMVKRLDRKSTRLNSSHITISYAVFCLKKKIMRQIVTHAQTHGQYFTNDQ